MTERGKIDAVEEKREDLWTIKKVLDWTTKFFEKQGIDSPRLDAEVLLAHALGVERIRLYIEFERPLVEEERAPFRELVTRRGKREPLAYLVGKKEFFSLSLEVMPGVLVPRPETEFVVDAVLDRTGQDREFTFMDAGTGSGCIAVAIAYNRPGANGFAIDSGESAVEVTRGNIERHGLSGRVEVVHGSFLERGMIETLVDVLFSNPPYVTAEEFEMLEPEIREYEPREALIDPAPDGLDNFRKLADRAPGLLAENGLFACELGAGRFDAAMDYLEASGNWTGIEAVKDFGNIQRVIVARSR
ncbi:MAG: peptide chain release factor N(5)-glutamine methyltransferase [Planctomycetota bacterium]|jgi:release factor glutamine methyltransferase